MSLHASVFCNCYETGNLRKPPPDTQGITVADDGDLWYTDDDFQQVMAFDRWRRVACEHKNGKLVLHCLGNIALIGLLRGELEREPAAFPILLGNVVYNGVHCGDFLKMDKIEVLSIELESLDTFVASSERNQEFINAFRDQMQELVQAARSVRKPICF